jgi:hypothetical protein
MAQTIHEVESRRDEFMMEGILKQMPLNAVDAANVVGTLNDAYEIKLRLYCPNTSMTELSGPWRPSCAVSEIFMFVTTH